MGGRSLSAKMGRLQRYPVRGVTVSDGVRQLDRDSCGTFVEHMPGRRPPIRASLGSASIPVGRAWWQPAVPCAPSRYPVEPAGALGLWLYSCLASCEIQFDQPRQHLILVERIVPTVGGVYHAVEPVMSLFKPGRALVI